MPPDPALAHAIALFSQGQRDAAVAAAHQLAQAGDPVAADTLGMFLGQMGHLKEAAAWFERAIALDGSLAGPREHLGDAHHAMNQHDQAVAAWEAAQEMDPDNPRLYPKLLMFLGRHRRYSDVSRLVAEAIQRVPDCLQAVAAAVPSLKDAGRAGEVVALLRETRKRTGPRWEIQEMLAMPLMYWHGADGREVCDEARELGRLLALTTPEEQRGFDNPPDPDRPLRIGYLSQDFRNQAAGHFAEPLFEHHDPGSFQLFGYYCNFFGNDELTARLRSKSAGWAEIQQLNDAALAERIRADRIDILVDLIALGPLNRLSALSRRLAPIQMTYLGHLGTTGLPTMDYRVVDAITDPPGSDYLATEKLIRLDCCFMCYQAPHHAPPVAARPADGPVVFGSFNTMIKINPAVAALWARVVRAVPGSRLIVKNGSLGNPDIANACRQMFAAEGLIYPTLELRGPTAQRSDHMAMYSEIDIALDTFPYNGSTTTMEALWMGVPVVTLEGKWHCARVSTSMLRRAGLQELIGESQDQYVQISTSLAENRQRLQELRGSLRALVASTLCDTGRIAKEMEGIYRDVWREWCSRKNQTKT